MNEVKTWRCYSTFARWTLKKKISLKRNEESPTNSRKSDRPKQRGSYLKFTPKEKAEIVKYTSEHGIARACNHFKEKNVKKSSIIDWRNAYEKELKKHADSKTGEMVSVESLSKKRRGRPSLLGTKLDEQLQAKIISMRSQQAVINLNIVLSIARALLLKDNKMLLTEFGGPIILEKEWARNVLKRWNSAKEEERQLRKWYCQSSRTKK